MTNSCRRDVRKCGRAARRVQQLALERCGIKAGLETLDLFLQDVTGVPAAVAALAAAHRQNTCKPLVRPMAGAGK